jgi:hypothetical protein
MARDPALTRASCRLRQNCNGHHEGEFAWIVGGLTGSIFGACSWADETLLAGCDGGSYLSRLYSADEFGREWDVPGTCDLRLCGRSHLYSVDLKSSECV